MSQWMKSNLPNTRHCDMSRDNLFNNLFHGFLLLTLNISYYEPNFIGDVVSNLSPIEFL